MANDGEEAVMLPKQPLRRYTVGEDFCSTRSHSRMTDNKRTASTRIDFRDKSAQHSQPNAGYGTNKSARRCVSWYAPSAREAVWGERVVRRVTFVLPKLSLQSAITNVNHLTKSGARPSLTKASRWAHRAARDARFYTTLKLKRRWKSRLDFNFKL